jgi:hypothetical protein
LNDNWFVHRKFPSASICSLHLWRCIENIATVALTGGSLISIDAGGDGIESSSNSMVSLTAPVCNIMPNIDAEGSSVVDTSGCGQLITQ